MSSSIVTSAAIGAAAQHRLLPNLLHKSSYDDVLLTYGHSALPARLSSYFLAALNDADADFLRNYYVQPRQGAVIENETSNTDWYYLKSIPSFISDADVTIHLDCEQGRRALDTYYSKADGGYILTETYVSEIDEMTILTKLDRTELWVDDAARVRIAEIVECHGIPDDHPRILYVTFYNDIENYYFYNKHHEHVPGIMTIEAGRQTLYAHHYHYSGYKRGEISISLADVHIDFYAYTNANYPIRIVVEEVGQMEERGRWCHKRATFYQCGAKVATFELHGKVWPMDKFKARRIVPVDKRHRFEPLANILCDIHLTGEDDHHHECTLNMLWADGLRVTFKPKTEIRVGSSYKFVLYAKNLGFFSAKAEVTIVEETGRGVAAELKLPALPKDDEVMLSEIIKNFTHVVPAHGVF
jgi:hypothetical protein